jgi:hypothetical protein
MRGAEGVLGLRVGRRLTVSAPSTLKRHRCVVCNIRVD